MFLYGRSLKASPGDDASRRPGMAEADASERDSPQAAEDSARSSKQIMADAIGSLFSVAEQVSVCFYCGSTHHDIHDCQDPAKPMIQKMLKEMEDRLTVEDPPEAVPPNTGADRTEPMGEEESSKEGVPVFNTSAEYQWKCRLWATVTKVDHSASQEGG